MPETKENLTQTKCIVKIDASTLSRVSAKDGWNQMSKLTKDIGISNHTINDPCQNCGIKKRVNIGIQHDGVSGEVRFNIRGFDLI